MYNLLFQESILARVTQLLRGQDFIRDKPAHRT